MHRHLRRTFAATGSTALLAAALLTAPAAQAAAATTCQARTVTIDATGQSVVTGTPGDDVILASQGSTVTALAGDDAICIVPGTGLTATTVDAGEGDDSVESGAAGQPNPNKVTLGAGDDVLIFHGIQTPAGSVDFGDGNNTLIDTDGGVVTIDALTRVLQRNGIVSLRWQGDAATFVVDSTASDVAFTGTNADETFVLRDPGTGVKPATVIVDMAGGDDTASIRSNVLDGSTWTGGDGTDLVLVAYDFGQLYLDLQSGQFETGAPDVSKDQLVTGFENVTAVTAVQTVKGTATANVLRLKGCDLRPVGRAGADTLVYGAGFEDAPTLTCPSVEMIARGGKDDDVIKATPGADRLLGNRGDDFVAARGGDDVVYGGLDDDRLRGKGGDDKLRGGQGDDELGGGAGNDRVQGDKGNDRLLGQPGDDVLVGGLDFDRAIGGRGVDTCRTSERRTGCES